MGTCLTYTCAAAKAAMRYCLEQFGPTLKDPLSYLPGPELTDELSQRMIDGAEDLTDGRSIHEMEILRDKCIIDIIKALSKNDMGAGRVLNKDYNTQKSRGLITGVNVPQWPETAQSYQKERFLHYGRDHRVDSGRNGVIRTWRSYHLECQPGGEEVQER